MACLSMRFSPARKAWKKFTSKLQSNLHKLQGSRTMKKQRNRANLATKGGEITASVMLEQRRRSRRKKRVKRRILFHFLVKKKPAPVYIDKLFKEPVSVLEFGAEINNITIKPPPYMGSSKHSHHSSVLTGTSTLSAATSAIEVEHERRAGGDMWEQVGSAAPLMYGIDARAEEFIARFREEMKNQEMLARDL